MVVLVWLVWSLASGIYPEWHPGWSDRLSWVVAAGSAVLVFPAVLAHEYAHSLAARALGLPVRNTTLFLFGGISNIEREPRSPATEFLMAIVGPLTNTVIGGLFLAVSMLDPRVGPAVFRDPIRAFAHVDAVSTILLWLGPINLLVAAFNLLPCLPLDGGRSLRSFLWAASGDLQKASRWSAGVGQFISWFFILAGIAMAIGIPFPVSGTGFISGLLMAFIGWLLNNAAQASYKQVLTKELLEDIPVYRLMRIDVPAVPPDLPVNVLVQDWIGGTDELSFPVIDHGNMLGFVAVEDIHKVKKDSWDQAVVGDIMTPIEELAVVTPREDLARALDKLAGRHLRQVPVVDQGHLIGILRRGDIQKLLQFRSRFVPG
jgi:Zn-dependent protease/predicted transcriptional regulator